MQWGLCQHRNCLGKEASVEERCGSLEGEGRHRRCGNGHNDFLLTQGKGMFSVVFTANWLVLVFFPLLTEFPNEEQLVYVEADCYTFLIRTLGSPMTL